MVGYIIHQSENGIAGVDFFKLFKPCYTFALALVCMILRLARAARLMLELLPDWFVGLVVDQFRIDQDKR